MIRSRHSERGRHNSRTSVRSLGGYYRVGESQLGFTVHLKDAGTGRLLLQRRSSPSHRRAVGCRRASPQPVRRQPAMPRGSILLSMRAFAWDSSPAFTRSNRSSFWLYAWHPRMPARSRVGCIAAEGSTATNRRTMSVSRPWPELQSPDHVSYARCLPRPGAVNLERLLNLDDCYARHSRRQEMRRDAGGPSLSPIVGNLGVFIDFCGR